MGEWCLLSSNGNIAALKAEDGGSIPPSPNYIELAAIDLRSLLDTRQVASGRQLMTGNDLRKKSVGAITLRKEKYGTKRKDQTGIYQVYGRQPR